MPFISQKQRAKCWILYNKAIKEGINASWDCPKWELETKRLTKKKLTKKLSRRKTRK